MSGNIWTTFQFYGNNRFAGNGMMINKYIIVAAIKKEFGVLGI